MERYQYWYIGNLHILANTCTTAAPTKQVARKVLFPPCVIENIPLSQIKMAGNARINIRKGLLVKSSQSQQLMQAADVQEEEIRISINLPYIADTRNLRRYIQIS